jgi:hypothetical protein
MGLQSPEKAERKIEQGRIRLWNFLLNTHFKTI